MLVPNPLFRSGLITLSFTLSAIAQIPPGYETVQFTFDPNFWERPPSINNCGQIVFSKRMGSSWSQAEIFLYDNGLVSRITDNSDRDVSAVINDEGTIAWARGIGSAGVHQIILYRDGEPTVLAEHYPYVSGPSINNLGHMIWEEWTDAGCEAADTRIRLFDGIRMLDIVTLPGSHQSEELNDYDDVAWTRYDWCVDPWDSDILLYSGGRITVLTRSQLYVQIPRINNLHQVVWGGPAGIEMWQPSPGVLLPGNFGFGFTVTITPNGVVPSLNNRGDISFGRFHDDTDTGQLWLYHDGEIVQLTDDPVWSSNDSRINDWGEIAWRISPGLPTSDLVFMRRIRTGEANFDGDIDLEDARVLHDCLTGPGDFDRLCDCRFLDLDHDRDVDLADFARFQRAYTGP